MKAKSILIIVSSLTICLAGCGNATDIITHEKTVQPRIEASTEIVSTAEPETTQEPKGTPEPEATSELQSTRVISEDFANDYSELDTATGMTVNSDGTYSFSEEFMGTITSYDYLDGATEAEVNEFLNFIAPMIEGLDGQGVHDFMAMFSGSLHQENVTITESQTGQTQNQGNQSSQSNQSNQSNSNTGNSSSGNNNNSTGNSNPTPPVNESNEGDGTFSFSDEEFGGGEHIDSGATLH